MPKHHQKSNFDHSGHTKGVQRDVVGPVIVVASRPQKSHPTLTQKSFDSKYMGKNQSRNMAPRLSRLEIFSILWQKHTYDWLHPSAFLVRRASKLDNTQNKAGVHCNNTHTTKQWTKHNGVRNHVFPNRSDKRGYVSTYNQLTAKANRLKLFISRKFLRGAK